MIGIRRSLLYVPGSSEKMIAKAKNLTADGIIFDLEDSVAPDEKNHARELVKEAVRASKSREREIIVRVNAMDTPWGVRDLLEVASCMPDTFIIPEATVPALLTADMVLTGVEKEKELENGTIGIIGLLETAEGIEEAYQIVRCTKRLNGIQFGAEDLTRSLDIKRTPEGEEAWYARTRMVYAGHAAGIDILDTPYVDIKNLDGLRRETEMIRDMGLTGKTCIHPSHIDTINDVFSVSDEEIAEARKLLEVYEEAVRARKGAIAFEGKMIDVPVVKRAEQLIKKAARQRR